MRKEDLIELVNYLAQTKEVQLMQKYQTQLQELVKDEKKIQTQLQEIVRKENNQ